MVPAGRLAQATRAQTTRSAEAFLLQRQTEQRRRTARPKQTRISCKRKRTKPPQREKKKRKRRFVKTRKTRNTGQKNGKMKTSELAKPNKAALLKKRLPGWKRNETNIIKNTWSFPAKEWWSAVKKRLNRKSLPSNRRRRKRRASRKKNLP